MIQSKDIKPGAIFEITILGETHASRIIAIEDGRVTVAAHLPRQGMSKSRWWLTYDQVKRDGRLLSKPAKVGGARQAMETADTNGGEDDGGFCEGVPETD